MASIVVQSKVAQVAQQACRGAAVLPVPTAALVRAPVLLGHVSGRRTLVKAAVVRCSGKGRQFIMTTIVAFLLCAKLILG